MRKGHPRYPLLTVSSADLTQVDVLHTTACDSFVSCPCIQIYTQMSKVLGKVFFPSNDPVLQVRDGPSIAQPALATAT